MNRLQNEQSPYLIEHATNPVDWYPWGDEAFARSKKENKPVFLSIGYSTCHWCHVMARESFENPSIASILNEKFISIKVDREERPDIDQVYMASVTAMTGQGGWPLSVFLTPEQKPFYGGTYFPPEARWGSVGFRDLLIAIDESWQKNPDQVVASSIELTDLLNRRFTMKSEGKNISSIQLDQMYHRLKSQFDSQYGGFGQAPKFPMGHNYSLLLRYWKKSGEPDTLNMVTHTLESMAKGGMYDQLSGGFHRYSTDQMWHLPHFEKMLYDQALLVRPFIETFQVTNDRFFESIARETLDYVLREMTDSKGGFYSAQDADSLDLDGAHSKEGAFYVWSSQEIEDLLGAEEAAIVSFYYGVQVSGNVAHDPHGEFVAKNVLSIVHTLQETALFFKKDIQDVQKIIEKSKQVLKEARMLRSHPHLDDKVLTDWNGLMISAFAHASMAFEDDRYMQAACRAADFIMTTLISKQGRLLHRYRCGDSGILGTLEDYAFFILGLLDVYEATFEMKYFDRAKKLTDVMIELFRDPESGGFFLTGQDAQPLILRAKEIYDGATPSGNSAAAMVLTRMFYMTGISEYRENFEKILGVFADTVNRHPEAHSFLLAALAFQDSPVDEIVLSGMSSHNEFLKMKKVVFGKFRPFKVVMSYPNSEDVDNDAELMLPLLRGRKPQHRETVSAYVCRKSVCLQPAHTHFELEHLLEESHQLPKVSR